MRRLGLVLGCLLFAAACGGNDRSTVKLGSYQFVGQGLVAPAPCSSGGALVAWSATFLATASSEADHIWVSEDKYGCKMLAPLHGAVLDAGGLSCPVAVAGFFRQDFSQFQWDFKAGTLAYTSTLYGQDANGAVVTYCGTVSGTTTMQ